METQERQQEQRSSFTDEIKRSGSSCNNFGSSSATTTTNGSIVVTESCDAAADANGTGEENVLGHTNSCSAAAAAAIVDPEDDKGVVYIINGNGKNLSDRSGTAKVDTAMDRSQQLRNGMHKEASVANKNESNNEQQEDSFVVIDMEDPEANSIDSAQRKRQRRNGRHNSAREAEHSKEKRQRERIQQFQYQNHSLRISVSKIAGLVGFNPFANIPELVSELLYQGYYGRLLLQKDMELLNIQAVDKDDELALLAKKAGPAAVRTLETIQQIQAGATKDVPQSIEAAKILTDHATAAVRQHVSSSEYKIYCDAIRHAVNTTYGTNHEDAALDLYQQRIGYPVQERNAEIRTWPFRCMDATTVQPIRDAYVPSRGWCKHRPNVETDVLMVGIDDARNDDDEMKNSKSSLACFVSKEILSLPLHQNSTDQQHYINAKQNNIVDLTTKDDDAEEEVPFFSILGSVDGIRDELTIQDCNNEGASAKRTTNDDEFGVDDTSWCIQRIIVECKHRMKKLHECAPPLYEQIQTVAYCYMYNAKEADIVQVLRNSTTNSKQRRTDTTADPPRKKKVTTKKIETERVRTTKDSAGKTATSRNVTTSSNKPCDCILLEKRQEKAETKNKKSSAIEKFNSGITNKTNVMMPSVASKKADGIRGGTDQTMIQIRVNRIQLQDPLMKHGEHWKATILPRLRDVVDMAYRIRCDDAKRYEFLVAMASSNVESRWHVLFQECPWLESCDTAYSRIR